MAIESKYFRNILDNVLVPGVVKATKYVAPHFTVKAARRLYNGKINSRARTIDLVVTIGKPNYAERAFIKECIAAGEPFPVRKVQLKFLKKKA